LLLAKSDYKLLASLAVSLFGAPAQAAALILQRYTSMPHVVQTLVLPAEAGCEQGRRNKTQN
jgi:hypothetical protein